MALRPISRIDDYAFPDDRPDVRGWRVRTSADEKKVGRVDDLLLGAGGEIAYADVDLGFLKKHVLVPLDRIRLERAEETVWLEGITAKRLEEAPEYALDPTTLDEDYERRLRGYYGPEPGTEQAGEPALAAPVTGPVEAPGTGSADAATAGSEDETLELERMGEIEGDYRVASDDPRGWKVLTGDGERVGKVSELLVAPGEMKARYLDVAVDEKTLDLERVDRHVLLPAERVRLDRSGKKVVVGGLLAHDLGEYPQYGGLPVRRGDASRIENYFNRASAPGDG